MRPGDMWSKAVNAWHGMLAHQNAHMRGGLQCTSAALKYACQQLAVCPLKVGMLQHDQLPLADGTPHMPQTGGLPAVTANHATGIGYTSGQEDIMSRMPDIALAASGHGPHQ